MAIKGVITMSECSKKNTCINYPEKCVNCGATSDIYNHYPCYKDVDEVKVVRCKNCKSYNGHRYCNYHADPVDDNDFCSYGERKAENG